MGRKHGIIVDGRKVGVFWESVESAYVTRERFRAGMVEYWHGNRKMKKAEADKANGAPMHGNFHLYPSKVSRVFELNGEDSELTPIE